MRMFVTVFLLFCFCSTAVNAEDFDSSIDESIRKEYVDNTDLPPLPSASASPAEYSSGKGKTSSVTTPVYNATGKIYTIKNGTKINLVSKTQIADWQKKGHIVSFSAVNGIQTKEGAIIPAGTLFKGRITDSHRPQISSNGGLVELCVDEIYYNGVQSKINTKVKMANSKKVYRNDIKGSHTYWKNFNKSLSPGRKVYNATSQCANVLLPIPVVNILAIIPWTCGVVVYTVNFVASPFIAIFSKGGSLSLPAGTNFQVIFKSDTQIKG